MMHMNEAAEVQPHAEWAIQDAAIRRQRAYADPDTGSDRHFAKASRLRAIGLTVQAEAEEAIGIARHAEIKEMYPGGIDKTRSLVPESVSRAQGKYILIQNGYWQTVCDHISALPAQEKLIAEVALNDTQLWRRDSPLLNVIAALLELTTAQMDQLFIEASGIEL